MSSVALDGRHGSDKSKSWLRWTVEESPLFNVLSMERTFCQTMPAEKTHGTEEMAMATITDVGIDVGSRGGG